MVLAAGCGPGEAEADAIAYAAAMESPLRENQLLSERFLDIASKVKKGEMDGGAIAEVMARDLVPTADALAAKARGIDPATPALDDAHATIVTAWNARAEAWHAMTTAWTNNDTSAFDAAVKQNLQGKLDEERYFTEVNAVVGELGVVVRQFP
jgi:hypothetical protein